MSPVRLDLHNHTSFSGDGLMTPGELLETAKARGIGCIAVTDHNTLQGALQALVLTEADSSLPRVIPGIELKTRSGEVIGLFVKEDLPEGLSLLDAVDLIRSRGGLVYLPHPYDVFRRGAISRDQRAQAAELADVVEGVNGRSLGPIAAAKAARLAAEHGRPRGAGSDAHHRMEVGRAYVVVKEYPTRETLVGLVANGTVEHSLGLWDYALNWAMQALAPLTRTWRKLTGSLPGR
jgi:predicted metal-dependent phosphoesterase TrpH